MNFRIGQIIILAALSLGLLIHPVYAGLNQFDASNSVVDLQEFMSGGPSKDGIPSLDNPKFVTAREAHFLQDDDKVIGVVIDGQAKAYPIRILNWHEIVNDQISDSLIAITWCPLTRSAVIFDRKINNQPVEFGVSGLLYNSNVVMYDRHSQGLWSQLKTSGLTGKFARNQLNIVPSQVIRWKNWNRKHPETLVLSNKTGHFRNYDRDPYANYHSSEHMMFPGGTADHRLRSKALILGVKIDDVAKAYSLKKLTLLESPLYDRIGDVDIQIHSLDGGAVEVTDKDGNVLPSIVAYWFAWHAFNEETLLY